MMHRNALASWVCVNPYLHILFLGTGLFGFLEKNPTQIVRTRIGSLYGTSWTHEKNGTSFTKKLTHLFCHLSDLLPMKHISCIQIRTPMSHTRELMASKGISNDGLVVQNLVTMPSRKLEVLATRENIPQPCISNDLTKTSIDFGDMSS